MAPYVLLVESDPDLQRQIADVLREADYELSTEREATWARRSLSVRPPQALVVDTSLSDGTGFEVADELRRDPDTANVPIFFVATGHAGAGHATEACRRFAPASYLPVPLDINSLLARLLETVPPPQSSTERRRSHPAIAISDEAQERETRDVDQQAENWRRTATPPPRPPRATPLPGLVRPRAQSITGSLELVSFAQVLRDLYVSRQSGALLAARSKRKKIVYLADGYPVAVHSNDLSECLGQILVSRKRISSENLDESVRLMKEQGRQQGEILIEMGVLSPHGLERALVEQMESKLFDLFGWTHGEFNFREAIPNPGNSVHLDRSTASLILEGVRRGYSLERQDNVLNTFSGKFVGPTSNPMLRMQDMTVDVQERKFIESLDGSRMLEQILNVPPIRKERARSLLVALIEAGMVEAMNEPIEILPDSGISVFDDAVAVPKDESELRAVLEAMRGKTHFEILTVPESADALEIESGYVRMARAYHPDTYRAHPEGVRRMVGQIFDRINEARTVLRDGTRRVSYLKRLAQARSNPGADDRAIAAAEAVYYTGVEHMRGRRYAAAVEALRNATELMPRVANYHNALGWALYRNGTTDTKATIEAKEELELAISLDDEDPWLKVSLGRFLSEVGNPEGAVAAFEAALRQKPDLPDIEPEVRRLRGEA